MSDATPELHSSRVDSLPADKSPTVRTEAVKVVEDAPIDKPRRNVIWIARRNSFAKALHGTPVSCIIVIFLNATDAVALRQVSVFWKSIMQIRSLWRGLYCRDFFVPQNHRKCVWVQLEGKGGRCKCLFHMYLNQPRRFGAIVSRMSQGVSSPATTTQEVAAEYRAWCRSLRSAAQVEEIAATGVAEAGSPTQGKSRKGALSYSDIHVGMRFRPLHVRPLGYDVPEATAVDVPLLPELKTRPGDRFHPTKTPAFGGAFRTQTHRLLYESNQSSNWRTRDTALREKQAKSPRRPGTPPTETPPFRRDMNFHFEYDAWRNVIQGTPE
jgi:hypothetical protein